MNCSRKLGLRLKWPEYLDSSKISVKTKGRIYELFAAVRNTATSKGNFYACSTKRKHPLKNKKNWFRFDDDTAEVESGEMKFIDDPCLLFFKKVDMPTSARVIFDP
jgi:ubiquitin C-terminal hydrolase